MTPYDPRKVPKLPMMCLATSEFVSLKSKIHIADFRDVSALYHNESQRYVGVDQSGAMKLGKGRPMLVNGIWYLEFDPNSVKEYREIPALNLELKSI